MAEINPKVNDKLDGCIQSKESSMKKDSEDKITGVADYNHNHQQPEIIPEKDVKPNDHHSNNENENGHDEEPTFVAKVDLPLIDTKTMEDDEDVIVEMRSRIYRYDATEDPPEFKERGTGTVKILRHKQTGMHRVLMRRDKTLKICANHYITSSMKLEKHNNSEKVFIYATLADSYENHVAPETFAIRFSNAENANIFRKAFVEAVDYAKEMLNEINNSVEPEKKEDEADEEDQYEDDNNDNDDDDDDDQNEEEGKAHDETKEEKEENKLVTEMRKVNLEEVKHFLQEQPTGPKANQNNEIENLFQAKIDFDDMRNRIKQSITEVVGGQDVAKKLIQESKIGLKPRLEPLPDQEPETERFGSSD